MPLYQIAAKHGVRRSSFLLRAQTASSACLEAADRTDFQFFSARLWNNGAPSGPSLANYQRPTI